MNEKTPPKKIIWINLREEPLIYINGVPYVLRDQYFTLRNIKSYSGITSTRLESIEMRLKEDVVGELHSYDEKILLHGEDEQGNIDPVWEDCEVENVLTMREAMDVLRDEVAESGVIAESGVKHVHVEFHRVPVTAETPPDDNDLDHMLQILGGSSLSDTAIIL